MPKFRFRLEASLKLAERVLDESRRQLAVELRRRQEIAGMVEERQTRWETALDGHREASRQRPEELGMWQTYTVNCLQLLRQSQEDLRRQEQKTEQARSVVVEANRQAEKFRRLKQKLALLFRQAELKREQALLDEAGQILYWRRRNSV